MILWSAIRNAAPNPWTIIVVVICVYMGVNQSLAQTISALALTDEVQNRSLGVLRDALQSDEFWPSIHAAEGLALAGHGQEVRELLEPKLKSEQDDQKRCGLARELVRAGDHSKASVMFDILAGEDSHGHVHAAESLYKVAMLDDGRIVRRAFVQATDPSLQLMTAAALGRGGSPAALKLLRDKLLDSDPADQSACSLGSRKDRRSNRCCPITRERRPGERRFNPLLWPALVGSTRRCGRIGSAAEKPVGR